MSIQKLPIFSQRRSLVLFLHAGVGGYREQIQAVTSRKRASQSIPGGGEGMGGVATLKQLSGGGDLSLGGGAK